MRAAILCALSIAASTPACAGDALFYDAFETVRLNDTGITFCGRFPTGSETCTPSSLQGQDAQQGRDALAAAGQLVKIGGGNAGFDFTKIANDGEELPPDAELGDGPHKWACTRDNVTGLIWEVKTTASGHLRNWSHTYTWYEPASADGVPGETGDSSTCSTSLGPGVKCNTTSYLQRMNTDHLCGAASWRLPNVQELQSIVDYDARAPAIDLDAFAQTGWVRYWTSTVASFSPQHVRTIDFYAGSGAWWAKANDAPIRVVSGGQQ